MFTLIFISKLKINKKIFTKIRDQNSILLKKLLRAMHEFATSIYKSRDNEVVQCSGFFEILFI